MEKDVEQSEMMTRKILALEQENAKLKARIKELLDAKDVRLMQMRLDYLIRVCGLPCFNDTPTQRKFMEEIETALTIKEECDGNDGETSEEG